MLRVDPRSQREKEVVDLLIPVIQADLKKWQKILLANLKDNIENSLEDLSYIYENGFKSVWKWTAQEIAVNLVNGIIDINEFKTAQAEFRHLKKLYESYVD